MTSLLQSSFDGVLKAAGGFVKVCIFLFALLAISLAFYEYSLVRRFHFLDGWRFASRDEVVTILKSCGAREVMVEPDGVFFHFGWAWIADPEELETKGPCFRRGLTRIHATAVSYDATG